MDIFNKYLEYRDITLSLQYPIRVLKTFEISYLSRFDSFRENVLYKKDDTYIFFNLDDNRILLEWKEFSLPTRVFLHENYLIVNDNEFEGSKAFDISTGKLFNHYKSRYIEAIIEGCSLEIQDNALNDQFLLCKKEADSLISGNDEKILWSTEIDIDIFSNFFLLKDYLITNQQKKVLHCFNWQTGEKLWEVDGDAYHKNPIHNIFNTRQVIWKDSIISAYSEIISLDIHTGEKKWQKPFRIGVNGVSVDSLGRLYTLTHSKYLVLEAESGDVVLEKPIQEVLANFDYSEIDFQCPFPIVTDKHVIFSNGTSHLLFVNKFTGDVEWSYHFEGAEQVGNPLKLENGRLFLVVDHQLVVMEEVKKPI